MQTLEETLDDIFENRYNDNEIYDLLIVYNKEEDIDIVIIKILDEYLTSFEESQYLISCINDLSDVVTIIEKTVMYNSKMDFSLLYSKILNVFNQELSIDDLSYLVNKSYDDVYELNIDISDKINFLKDIMMKKNYAKVPKWVSVKKGENLSLLNTVYPGQALDEIYNSQTVRNIMHEHHSLFKDLGVKIENKDILESVQAYLSTQVTQDGIDSLSEPSRIFGPPNAAKNRNCFTSPLGAGPCRMLECECVVNDELIVTTNWFNKYCQECQKIIRDKSHAVRYPCHDGSWKGCYCSFDCMIENRGIEDDNDELFRMRALEFVLYEKGIMDRLNV